MATTSMVYESEVIEFLVKLTILEGWAVTLELEG